MEIRDDSYSTNFNSQVEISVKWDIAGPNPGHFREKDRIEMAMQQLHDMEARMQRKLRILRDMS